MTARWSVAALLLALTSVALPGVAAADTSVAETTFKKGRELLKQGKYEEACAAFAQSQALDPQFGTLYNLASCDEQIGKLATAWTAFRELAQGDTNAERRARSAAEAKQLEARVPHVIVKVPPDLAGVTVTLDGQDITNLVGIAAPIDLGSHVVAVTANDGYAKKRKFVAREEAETTAVDMATDAPVEQPDHADTHPAPRAQVHAQPGPEGDDRGGPATTLSTTSSSRRGTGKVLTFGGGAVFVGGLVVGALAVSAYHDAQSASDANAMRTQSQSAVTLGDVSTAAVVVGAVATAVGIYLWRTAPAPFVAPRGDGGATVGIAGHF